MIRPIIPFASAGMAVATLAGLATPITAQILERPPTTAPTIMSDATPPAGVTTTAIPAGITVSWQPVTGAVGYTLCRESPPGSATCTPLTASPLPATTAKYFDVGLAPGGSHAYRVTAWRADQHHGTAPPVAGRAGDVPAPGNLRILEDRSMQSTAELLLGWDAPAYYATGGRQANAGTFRFSGSGLSAPQLVNDTRFRLGLNPGDHQWQVTALIPDPAGGWFESPTPATIAYKAPGRYRLVALGFKVMQQATEPVVETDGVGNEVYAAATVTATTTTLSSPVVRTIQSATFGSTGKGGKEFPGRIQAGSASRTGGLTIGDLVPAGLSLGAPTGTVGTAGFPLLLWEGKLNDQVMLVVHPTLWEEDPDHAQFATWRQLVEAKAQGAYGSDQYAVNNIMALRDRELPTLARVGRLFSCQDDILNLSWTGSCRAQGTDRPLGLKPDAPGTAIWEDHFLVLTRAQIEAALQGTAPRPGAAPGVIVVSLIDSGLEAKARYELYLKVERLP